MSGFTRDDLEKLLERRNGDCVSIYMPTARLGVDTKQSPIRLKNVLGLAARTLEERGHRSSEIAELLKPAESLGNDTIFWQHQSNGLALFLADGFFTGFRIPLNVAELAIVGHRFHVKPLLPLLSGDGRFLILALSQAEVRVLEGTQHSVSELELDSVPASLADALKYDLLERQHQLHSVPTPGGGSQRQHAVFHGHGVGRDDSKDAILRYFRMIDHGLNEMLASAQEPLVVAGVEYLHPIYREANTYPRLLDEGVPGNVEELSADELHHRAWAVVQPSFESAERTATELYGELQGTGRVSTDPDEIVLAAREGRVETLFVDVSQHVWGAVDPAAGVVERHDSPEPGSDDLLDQAAVHTLRNSGTVYAGPSDKVPGGGPLAAVYRY